MSRRAALVLAVIAAAVLAGCTADATGTRGGGTDPASPRTLLVIGDSYAAGVGADAPSTSFAWQLGRDLGLRTAVDGVGGTGFVNPGPAPGDHTYLDRLLALPADDLAADLVVVEGGLNDRQYPARDVESATHAFLAELQDRAPGATVVLVGAPAPVPEDPTASAAVNVALSRAAAASDVVFIDPTAGRWFTVADVSRYVTSDEVHPTQEGHDYFARRIAEEIDTLLGD